MTVEHELRVLPTAEDAANAAAEVIASLLVEAGAERAEGTASVAFSGGSSPTPMFARLAELGGRSLGSGAPLGLDWESIDVFQVDERVAPDGDPDRNLVALSRELTDRTVPGERMHAMPVTLGAEESAREYAGTLVGVLGSDPAIDVVHLGIGDDGHCASLVPGDGARHVSDVDVTSTGEYQGRRRVTMTYPMLDRSRTVVWLIAGASKAQALQQLLDGDPSIPASHVSPGRSIIIADAAAAPGD